MDYKLYKEIDIITGAIKEVVLLDPTFITPDMKQKNYYSHEMGNEFDPQASAYHNDHILSRVATMPSGHEIYSVHTKNEPHLRTYYAWHPADRIAHMTVTGETPEHDSKLPVNFKIGMLGGHARSTIRAADFYRHMIHMNEHHDKHPGMVLTTNEQTIGGLRTWQHLAQNHPDVYVRAYYPTEQTGKAPKLTGPLDLRDTSKTHAFLPAEGQRITKATGRALSAVLIANRKSPL